MAHFAKVNNGIVEDVIVAEQSFIDSLPDASSWIQTSYNTHGGVHDFGGTPLRKNFAGIGYIYDAERDAFMTPKPHPSWILNEDSCVWFPPLPRPSDSDQYIYIWDEESISWVRKQDG